MENEISPIDQISETLVINAENRQNLQSTASWGMFLAIVGFIFVSIIVVMALMMGTLLSSLGAMAGDELPFPPALFSIFYFILAAIYFIPIWYLYQFSGKMKSALQNNLQSDLNSSFSNLKALYKFSGILAIIIIGIYVLAIIGGILFAGSMAALIG